MGNWSDEEYVEYFPGLGRGPAVERGGDTLNDFEDFALKMAQVKGLTVLCVSNWLDGGRGKCLYGVEPHTHTHTHTHTLSLALSLTHTHRHTHLYGVEPSRRLEVRHGHFPHPCQRETSSLTTYGSEST